MILYILYDIISSQHSYLFAYKFPRKENNMSKKYGFGVLSLELTITDEEYGMFSEGRKARIFWFWYILTLAIFMFPVAIGALIASFITNIILPEGGHPWFIFPAALLAMHIILVVFGRKGLVYCEEEVDGNVLTIQAGTFKFRDIFRKSSSSN
ncbi:MAG TPA: hypothetical protein PKC05_00515 [Candidatus Saccharibacteria bacterium]|nr:hypothetical protein [Candidatus Saccharibacteria bacterium]